MGKKTRGCVVADRQRRDPERKTKSSSSFPFPLPTQAGLDAGLDLPHDCKMGVCMRCSSRLVSCEKEESG